MRSLSAGTGRSSLILATLTTCQHPGIKIGSQESPQPPLTLAYGDSGNVAFPRPTRHRPGVQAAKVGGDLFRVQEFLRGDGFK
jgi:hypothetical protein